MKLEVNCEVFAKMNKITNIWFDLEGTLLRNTAYDYAIEDFAYQLFLQVTEKQQTTESKKEFETLLKQHVRKSLLFAALGKDKKFYAHSFISSFSFESYVFPDKNVQEVISFLKQKKIGIGIYTFLQREPLVKVLTLLGLNPADFTLLSGDDVKNGKPDPEGFEKIVQLCGVPAQQILFVGDSEQKDIVPAKGVGMKTLFVYDHSLIADYSVIDFKELLYFFKDL